MSNTYYFENIDLSKKQIIAGNLVEQIDSFETSLDLFRKEIIWWFSCLNDDPNHSNYLRKPICIELYEYTNYIQWLKNKLITITNKVNNIYEESGYEHHIKPPQKNISQKLENIKKELHLPRHRVSAHRYTDKSNNFLTVGEIMLLISKISNSRLNDIKKELFDYHDSLIKWIQINKPYFILAID